MVARSLLFLPRQIVRVDADAILYLNDGADEAVWVLLFPINCVYVLPIAQMDAIPLNCINIMTGLFHFTHHVPAHTHTHCKIESETNRSSSGVSRVVDRQEAVTII
mmetsp:Transcript_27858/g.50649  ORF Transcript_27858/g.50649 Transcript_27858/m.50649 type:complete len:106 (+) Transcript_27858:527-844(+)